jgi:hypothetical protein
LQGILSEIKNIFSKKRLREAPNVKKKLLIAAVLLIGFVSALTFSRVHYPQMKTEGTTVNSKPSKKDGTVVFKGENDYWNAEYLITKYSVSQLKLKHKSATNKLPQQLTFTLSTAFNKDKKQTQIGAATLSFETFPNEVSFAFKEDKILKPFGKNLVLKINGEGHYQFFNLYVVE